MSTETEKNALEPPEPVPVSKPKGRPRTFAATLQQGNEMASGIAAHQVLLATRGLDDVYGTGFSTLVATCVTLDGEQEILKGQLKEKTVELNANMKELRKQIKQNSLIIKATIPQHRWVDFGMSATR